MSLEVVGPLFFLMVTVSGNLILCLAAEKFDQVEGKFEKLETELKDRLEKAEKLYNEETTKTREERKKLMDERRRVLAMAAELEQNAEADSAKEGDNDTMANSHEGTADVGSNHP